MVIKDPMDHSLSSIYAYYVMKAIYCVKNLWGINAQICFIFNRCFHDKAMFDSIYLLQHRENTDEF